MVALRLRLALALALVWVLPPAAAASESSNATLGGSGPGGRASLLRFAAVGDWGAQMSDARRRGGQRAVADGLASWLEEAWDAIHFDAMASWGGEAADRQSAPFVLSLGDNFYPHGVKHARHMAGRFRHTFEDVYDHAAFEDVPWYVVAGNKDYHGDVSAQVGFDDGSSRWIFPDYFHTVVREVADDDGSAVKVEIVAIDTMRLSRTYPKKSPFKKQSGHHRLKEVAEEGMRWVRDKISRSDADYLIVVGHYPAYMVPGLEDLLPLHAVSAYVSGHLHCQQLRTKDGVRHIVSGAGMELDRKKFDCGENAVDRDGARGGFLTFDVGVEGMRVSFRDEAGEEIHHVEIGPRLMRGEQLGEEEGGGSVVA